MHIRTVGVLGCGLMGSGIAQVCAAAGYRTIVREVDDGFLQKGLGRIRMFLEDGIARGKVMPDTRDAMLARLSGTTSIEALKECDVILEAIVENLEAKRATYVALEKVVAGHAIFLSNTSSLCITELAAATSRPDRFGGLAGTDFGELKQPGPPPPRSHILRMTTALATTRSVSAPRGLVA